MKNRTMLISCLCLILMSVLPVCTSACGGYISIKGEKIYHSVYCHTIAYQNLDDMRWYDTTTEAERYGLKMCEECDSHYGDDFNPEYCESYWMTDDHLLLTAMELSLEQGIDSGYEIASEELSGDYDRGFESGYDKGREDGISYAREEAAKNKEISREKSRESWDSLFNSAVWIAVGIFGLRFLWIVFEIIIDSVKKKIKK